MYSLRGVSTLLEKGPKITIRIAKERKTESEHMCKSREKRGKIQRLLQGAQHHHHEQHQINRCTGQYIEILKHARHLFKWSTWMKPVYLIAYKNYQHTIFGCWIQVGDQRRNNILCIYLIFEVDNWLLILLSTSSGFFAWNIAFTLKSI